MKNNILTNLINHLSLKKILLAFFVFCLGGIAVVSARFILVENHSTHYHANFALYVDGDKEEFNSFVYYEEVSACTDEYSNNPKSRAHMHDNVSGLVHVHDKAVTWSHFFSNLGITFADGLLYRSGELIKDSSDFQFTYILNGKTVDSIADKVIESGDSLLINIGKENVAAIKERYDLINKNATEYNEKPDPSSCAGSASEGFKDRLQRTLIK